MTSSLSQLEKAEKAIEKKEKELQELIEKQRCAVENNERLTQLKNTYPVNILATMVGNILLQELAARVREREDRRIELEQLDAWKENNRAFNTAVLFDNRGPPWCKVFF